MLPIIALIGRTNVGKSTLFNILTKKRNALVANISGLTRDRNYELCYLRNNKQCILIDTAGFDFTSKIIKTQAYQQTLIAIQESDLILFIVSAKAGLLPQEYEILKKIKKYQKEPFLIINKIDGINNLEKTNEFYSLGIKKNITISATHNQGINDLIDQYLIPWIQCKKIIMPSENIKKNELIKKDMLIKIAFIGKPNAGKSTLINALLTQNRIITSEIPGTTLDVISVPIEYNKKKYVLIDTAGISKNKRKNNKIESISMIKSLNTIKKTDIALLIIDAKSEQNKICNQNLLLINMIENYGKPLIIIINKWDLLNSLEKYRFQQIIKYQLKNFFFFNIHFISALKHENIFEIFKIIENFDHAHKTKIKTSKLMKIMKQAIIQHQPPMIRGRRIKLKYIHLGNDNPIEIIIHGNQTKYLPIIYKKYLKKFFYQNLQINGMPIKIIFKETQNPYI